MQPEDEWIEEAAAAEHESWSGWMRWMLTEIERDLDKERVTIDTKSRFLALIKGCQLRGEGTMLSCMKRWRRQMNTTYANLSEKEKESDRIEARKKAPAYERAWKGE